MKSNIFLCRLIAIDTLIAFNGIITSAPDFQLKLIALIEQFNKALLTENHDGAESEVLCQFLCCYFDRRLTGNGRGDLLHWHRYSLEHHFYGYSENNQDTALSSQLRPLLSSRNAVMAGYAWKFLMLLEQTEGQSETLVALRKTYREHLFADVRRRPAIRTESFVPRYKPEHTGSARMMVLIIGPFARKWFRQFDLFSNNNGQIVWVVAEHATTVIDRLAHIKTHHPDMAVHTYFPLLADGFETSSIMIEQVMAWLDAFKSVQLSEPLHCFLGLYTRLSLQRDSHDPDKAIWSGRLASGSNGNIKLESQLIELINELEVNSNDDFYAVQRYALGSTLVAWLAEHRIMGILQTLFDGPSLKLSGVTLADYGVGFTRHGAWSTWLADKYTILPGLSAAITLPPLPEIILPLPTCPPPESLLPRVVSVNEPPVPIQSGWPGFTLPLGLAVCLTVVVACYVKLKTERVFPLLSDTALTAIGLQKEASGTPPAFFPSAHFPLFRQGSSRLMPDSEKVLTEVAAKMKESVPRTYLIIGHTDSSGTTEQNNALSFERARVIRDWLVEKSGLTVSHFIITGAGNARPVASNDSPEGRARNRRVEIIPLNIQDQ